MASYSNGTRDDTSLGFLWSTGKYTPINPLGVEDDCAGGTVPAAINPQGDVVGWYTALPDCSGRGFRLSNGVYTNIDVPGALATSALAINPEGDVLGDFDDNSSTHGFLLRKGTFTILDLPGAALNFFLGMNPQEDIVGAECCLTPSGGFLLSHGKVTAIDAPGASLTLPYGIDPQGNIVGAYVDTDGRMHGFVLVKH